VIRIVEKRDVGVRAVKKGKTRDRRRERGTSKARDGSDSRQAWREEKLEGNVLTKRIQWERERWSRVVKVFYKSHYL